jgi:UDP-GlcNAc:undecaprenyl-phosphate GlcNAc-1-phosphate transferase
VTIDHAVTALFAGVIGIGVAAPLADFRTRHPPSALMRTSVTGRDIPAVLGGPMSIAALLAAACLAIVATGNWEPARLGALGIAVPALVVIMALAGTWDDLRGAERARGFGGHTRALVRGRITGGAVKIVAGALAGLIAGALVSTGRGVLEVALLVALTANLINLLDRAPGRAGKGSLAIAVPLFVFGSPTWVVASSGLLGGLLACLPKDLKARAMLGDAGANPLGAVLGLGLGVSLPEPARFAALGLLAAANLASERWSFSETIDKNGLLRALDRWGTDRK